MNKPDTPRRSRQQVSEPGSANAFTAFVRAEMERAFSGNQSALAEASGLSRDTINRLVNDTRPALSVMPNKKTLQSLATAFGVPFERVEVVARQAESPHDPTLPPSPADLTRAYTDDLYFEIQRRERQLEAENDRREEMREEVLQLCYDMDVAFMTKKSELELHLDMWAQGMLGDSWEEPVTPEGMKIPALRAFAEGFGGNGNWTEDRPKDVYIDFTMSMSLRRVQKVLRTSSEMLERYLGRFVAADRIEDDPLPVEEWEQDKRTLLATAKLAFSLMSREAAAIERAHPIPAASKLAVRGMVKDALTRRPEGLPGWVQHWTDRSYPEWIDDLSNEPFDAETDLEEPGWAARDWPDWAEKPDPDEDFEGGA
ncbi:helix-turn-helix domain-containing protein [Segniliparus rotundus]|uniref:helix-turn-helix domain-containing protein n=1 Tax=Segniliparus rotundus TaxID=286802 RepID=UPI0002D93799|nr:helix-turn-helix domain-containing protein [Segniliparus rotundus]